MPHKLQISNAQASAAQACEHHGVCACKGMIIATGGCDWLVGPFWPGLLGRYSVRAHILACMAHAPANRHTGGDLDQGHEGPASTCPGGYPWR